MRAARAQDAARDTAAALTRESAQLYAGQAAQWRAAVWTTAYRLQEQPGPDTTAITIRADAAAQAAARVVQNLQRSGATIATRCPDCRHAAHVVRTARRWPCPACGRLQYVASSYRYAA